MPQYGVFFNHHAFSEPTESISALAFSPAGDLLASGGDDGNIIIWDPLKGHLLYRLITNSAIICMAWDTDMARKRLFVGCIDGSLSVVEHLNAKEPSNNLVMSGSKAPVFAITPHQGTGCIAFAVGSEIHLAKELGKEKYATFIILPAPEPLPNTSVKDDQRIRGRSLSFKENGKHLIVAYLNHGIVCWELSSMSRLWRIVPIHRHGMIGHAALSPDENSIVLSNLHDGADIYTPGQSYPRLQLRCGTPSDVKRNLPVQVTFIDGGRYASWGSAGGDVGVWDTVEGQRMQVLDHQGCMVQAVTSFDHPRFTLIATATSQTAENTTVRVWKAAKNIQLRTFTHYIKIWGEKLTHQLTWIISSDRWFVHRIFSCLPVAISVAIFCQYSLGMNLPGIVVDLWINTQLGAVQVVHIMLGWWKSFIHSTGHYFHHTALALVGQLYEQLQGAGVQEDPLPPAGPPLSISDVVYL